MKPTITLTDAALITQHWLGTRPFGYLGSDYGADVKEMLLNPMATGVSQSFISKMRNDVPLLTVPGYASAVKIYTQDTPPDKRELVIDIAGQKLSTQG